MELTRGQRAVVEHEGGNLRVRGGFGSGTSTALRARADRLRRDGRRPLLLRHAEIDAFALDLLRRHGRPVSLLSGAEQIALVATMLDPTALRPRADEAARALVAFQSSFLGDEELRVHADAAGPEAFAAAESLIALAERYLATLATRNRVDPGGAVVQASLLLRDENVVASERSRLDEVLVDDFQHATFATNRLLGQLAGPPGASDGIAVTVGGNPGGAVSTEPLASAVHLERFERRFGTALDVRLEASHRSPGVPTLRLVGSADEARQAAAEAVEQAAGMGIERAQTAIVTHERVEAATGREWPLVVVPDATDGAWPAARRDEGWFDEELLRGPDVTDDATRDQRWLDLERRRFAVATSRATRFLVVIAEVPVSRFVGDLVRQPDSV